jgi:hypothetical protein
MNSLAFLFLALIIMNVYNLNANQVSKFITGHLLVLIILLLIDDGTKKRQERYNYDEENPNALIYGQNVAGSRLFERVLRS